MRIFTTIKSIFNYDAKKYTDDWIRQRKISYPAS
jgi:hypothetical protein